MRRLPLLLPALLTTLLLGCAGPTDAAAPAVPVDAFEASVERVVDGDTFVASAGARRHVRVRLIGIDAPESVRPDAPVECHGRAAGALLERLLPAGTRVRAAYQGRVRRDAHGRDLWDVWLPDGRFLQAVLVRAGAAEARRYHPHGAHAAYLDAVMREARAERAGLHTCAPPPTPLR